jgi:hypothetical protein
VSYCADNGFIECKLTTPSSYRNIIMLDLTPAVILDSNSSAIAQSSWKVQSDA